MDFSSNTNVAGIEQALTGRIGISENLNIPPERQSRLPLAANIRHWLMMCAVEQCQKMNYRICLIIYWILHVMKKY